MKKYLVILVALIGFGTVHAQESKFTPSFEIGYGFLSSKGDGTSYTYRAVLGANYHITDPLYVGAKIGYNSSTFCGSGGGQSYTLTNHLITLPLEVGYRLGNAEKFSLSPMAGIDLNYSVKSKMEIGGHKSSYESDDKFTVDARVGLRLGIYGFQISGAYVFPLNDTHKDFFGTKAYPEISIGFSF